MTTTAPRKAPLRIHPLLWAGAAALLIAPAAAMLITPEVDWGAEDFAAFAFMLILFSLAVEAAWHWLHTPWQRFAAVVFAVLAFLTVWAELAVGLFD